MKSHICVICKVEQEFSLKFIIENPRKLNISAKKFSYLECGFCKLWMILPRPSARDFAKIYKDNYYPDLEAPVKNSILEKIYNLKIFSSYEDFVNKQVFGKNKKLLDIGCGTGIFLEKMSKKGFIPFGLDPFKDAVNLTRNRIGDSSVLHGYINDLTKLQTKFDIVTMWHVLEHTLDPIEDLKVIRCVLKKDGKLIFEVPNADSYVMSIFKENYSWNMVPEHHIYFGQRAVKEALSRSGFKIEKIYSPPRALLNFSNSLNNLINKKFMNKRNSMIIYIMSIPISVIVGLASSYFKRGEVLRVVAHK